MYTIFTLLVIFVASNMAMSISETIVQDEWENFKLKHGKSYNSKTEEHYRKKIFKNNLYMIIKHNKLYEMKLKTYEMGMNHFGDLLAVEFMNMFNMSSAYLADNKENLSESSDGFYINAPPTDINVTDLHASMDWRNKGAVTRVKNQRSCRSCWSFSATGVLEGQWFRKTRKLISLSEQNLLDCSWGYNNDGCDGGLAINALRYIKSRGGIASESSYPYRGRNSHQCKYSSKMKVATVKNVVLVPRSEKELLNKVSSVGPIAVSIAISKRLQFYKKEVFNDPKCGDALSHAVLVVGYGTEKGKNYWLVKNSWGQHWGDKGYIKMSRNKNNQCGIANRISYPLV